MKGKMHVTKKGREQLARIKKGKKIKEELVEVEAEAEKKMPDIETRLLRLENVSRYGEALVYKIKKLEERMDKLEQMFAALLQMRNPVAQPKAYRSGEWRMRSGNVYQDVALPESPNAEETKTATPAKTPDDQRGDLPPPEQR